MGPKSRSARKTIATTNTLIEPESNPPSMDVDYEAQVESHEPLEAQTSQSIATVNNRNSAKKRKRQPLPLEEDPVAIDEIMEKTANKYGNIESWIEIVKHITTVDRHPHSLDIIIYWIE